MGDSKYLQLTIINFDRLIHFLPLPLTLIIPCFESIKKGINVLFVKPLFGRFEVCEDHFRTDSRILNKG